MGRLTRRNSGGDVVWYKSGDLWLEPCEIRSYSDIGTILRRLASFEDLGVEPGEIRQSLKIKHGHWIPTGESNSTGPIVRCSICGQYINPSGEAIDLGRQKLEPAFCEKCGAPMDGG